jgi:hypothetical protein
MKSADPKTIRLWHDEDGYALEVPTVQIEMSARTFEKFLHLLLTAAVSEATYQRLMPLLQLDGADDSYSEMVLDPVN